MIAKNINELQNINITRSIISTGMMWYLVSVQYSHFEPPRCCTAADHVISMNDTRLKLWNARIARRLSFHPQTGYGRDSTVSASLGLPGAFDYAEAV
jgi:hypothetical protein